MRLYFYAEINLVSDARSDTTSSPEDFLSSLEDALESGDLTLDEVHQLLSDHNSKNTR